MKDQSQIAGDNSTNVAAGRDVHLHAASREQMRDIAMSVYFENFLKMQEHAADLARARAEEVTNDLVERLSVSGLSAETFSDPDFQQTVFNAQKGYALSGEPDLKQILLDLVARRTEDSLPLENIVLNEAVTVAPKLTEEQRKALALVFVLKNVRPPELMQIDLRLFLQNHLLASVEPLMDAINIRAIDCRHIEYVGAGRLEPLRGGWSEILQRQVPEIASGRVHANFLRSIPVALRTELLVEDVPDWYRLPLALGEALEVAKTFEPSGTAEAAVSAVYERALWEVDDADVKSRRVAPELATIIDGWELSPISDLTLTTVGMAIGHAYWTNVIGVQSAFADWLTA